MDEVSIDVSKLQREFTAVVDEVIRVQSDFPCIGSIFQPTCVSATHE